MTVVNLCGATEGVDDFDARPRYNIAPTQRVAVARPTATGREIVGLQWGLVPAWAKARDLSAGLINARSETVSEKPSFRHAFRSRRCLVPADGFYEWKAEGNVKQPYRMTLGNGGGFAFAAIWERWDRDAVGAPLETFAIVTTTANALLQPIHHRMPVILDDADHDTWLDTSLPTADILALLRPFPAERMVVRRAGTRVNSVANDSPDCMAEDASPPPPARPRQLGLF